MEALTPVVTALALGAAAGLQETIARAVQDAYEGLKALIRRKYQDVDLATLESDPSSPARRSVITEDLAKAGAETDLELFESADTLMRQVEAEGPGLAAQIGVDLADIKAASLLIRDVIASGTGVKARNLDITGHIEISGITTANERARPPRKR